MSKLERQLSLPSVVAISISTMLGSGIFVLPGLAAAKTGPSVWLAYLVAGLCVLPAALSKAELGTAMPTSGGTYVYLDRTFGPLVGTISGIGLWLSLLLKSAFALVGFSAYLLVLADLPIRVTALVVLAMIVIINIRGVRGVSQVQIFVMAVSILGLVGLFAASLGGYDPTRLEPMFAEGGGGFIAAVGFVFVSYAGVTKVAAIAEEVRRPERNLPRGMMISLGLVMVIYGGLTFVLVGRIDLEFLANDVHPIYTLAAQVGGPQVGIVAAVLGIVTMASMANAGLLASSRFPFAMSRDQLLPPILHTLHSRHLTPVVSILISGGFMALVIATMDVERIAKLASAFMIMVFMTVNASVIVLRETGVQWYRPAYRSPLYPWVQLFGMLSCAVLLVVMGPLAIVAAVGIAVPGLFLFLGYGRTRATRRGVVGIRGPRKDLLRTNSGEFRNEAVSVPSTEAVVVVALFGTERSPELLVEHGAALAHGGRIKVVYVTEIPEQTALDAVEDNPKINSIQRRVEAMAQAQSIPLVFEADVSRDILRTVNDLSSEVQCEWLLMGWGGRTSEAFTFRNPIGWLKDHLSCNLATFHDAGVRYIRKILVHVEPGPHDALVTRTADHLAEVHGADLTFVRFVPDSAPRTRLQSEGDYLDQVRQLCNAPSKVFIAQGRNEAEAIGRASASFDLLVTTEAPTRSGFSQLLGGGHDRLTEAAACSVLRVQTPRVQTHTAMEQSRSPAEQFTLMDWLLPACNMAGLEPVKKDVLFNQFARTFADALPGVDYNAIERALNERERTQNTAVGHGVALPHATLDTLDRAYLSVFTTAEPIDYQAPDSEGVDVFFVTIGPPSTRQIHLLLLASVAKLVLKTSLLDQLRAATTADELVAAMESCSREIE